MRRSIRPYRKKIEELIQAAQEVAKGTFDVKIDEHMLTGKPRDTIMKRSSPLPAKPLSPICAGAVSPTA